jgi:hypothetical protein
MIAVPQRMQLSRRKGFDLQAASRALNGLPCVNCARPFRWGNTWKIGSNMWDARHGRFRTCQTVEDCVQAYRQSVDWDPDAKQVLVTPWEDGTTSVLEIWGGYGPYHRNRKTIVAELGDKNLACWCRLDAPCHVTDVLLPFANPRSMAA